MPHAVAFKEQSRFQRIGWNCLKIVRPVQPRRSVQISRADFFGILEIIARRIFAAVEHDMLKQMGKSGLPLGFMFGTHAIPDRNRNNGCFAILIDKHSQTIGKREFFVRNIDLLNQVSNRSRLALRHCAAGQCDTGHRQRQCKFADHNILPKSQKIRRRP